MKLSVSLPEDDVDFLDGLVMEGTSESRSAAVQLAIRTLRTSKLEVAYEAAWQEWNDTGEAEAWGRASGGRHDATR